MFFLAPPPSNSQSILGTPCRDTRILNGTPPGLDWWMYIRPEGKCSVIETHMMTEQIVPIVYTFQVKLF